MSVSDEARLSRARRSRRVVECRASKGLRHSCDRVCTSAPTATSQQWCSFGARACRAPAARREPAIQGRGADRIGAYVDHRSNRAPVRRLRRGAPDPSITKTIARAANRAGGLGRPASLSFTPMAHRRRAAALPVFGELQMIHQKRDGSLNLAPKRGMNCNNRISPARRHCSVLFALLSHRMRFKAGVRNAGDPTWMAHTVYAVHVT
jgi:hypothetical protein